MSTWNKAKSIRQLLTVRSQFKKLFLHILLTVMIYPLPAHSLNIEFDYDESRFTENQRHAMEQAATMWEERFSDPITVLLNVDIAEPEAFGAASNALMSVSVTRTRYGLYPVTLAMRFDADSNPEKRAVDSISTPVPIAEINGIRDARDVYMTSANAKALGLSVGQDPIFGEVPHDGADAIILINSAQLDLLDFNRDDGIDSGKFDFTGAFAHEIGHALGFVSATDYVDANPVLDEDDEDIRSPTTLDLWRFYDTDQVHFLDQEHRYIKSAAAEYYNSVLNNVDFSHGMMHQDPDCTAADGRCQASHWSACNTNDRDTNDRGSDDCNTNDLLMSPSIAPEDVLVLGQEDVTAIDYIGYDPERNFSSFNSGFTQFFMLAADLDCEICMQGYQKILPLAKYPAPPINIKPPFKEANLRLNLYFSANVPGLENRSAAGFAEFAKQIRNPDQTTINPPGYSKLDWEALDPVIYPMRQLPPRLNAFYFETESKNGPKLRFNAVIPASGAHFNKGLGRYGGYRLGGFLGVDQDKDSDDIDGMLSIELLLAKPVDGSSEFTDALFFVNAKRQDGKDSYLAIRDFRAFGLDMPDLDKDGIEDSRDNCPKVYNPDQMDRNNDGTGDLCSKRSHRSHFYKFHLPNVIHLHKHTLTHSLH